MSHEQWGVSPSLLYISGSGHSGSSLLDVLLGASGDMSSTGELHRLSLNPSTRQCACGETLERCAFWSGVLLTYNQEEAPLDSWRSVPVTASGKVEESKADNLLAQLSLATGYGLTRRRSDALQAQYLAAENTWRVVRSICRYAVTEVVVDSTKSPTRMNALERTKLGDYRIVCLTRDPRAVVASRKRREGTSAIISALKWNTENIKMLVMALAVPERHRMSITYEELCASPLQTINAIRGHLGLSRLDYINIPRPGMYHSIPGNPMLLRDITRIHSDERWRAELGANEIMVVTAICKPIRNLVHAFISSRPA